MSHSGAVATVSAMPEPRSFDTYRFSSSCYKPKYTPTSRYSTGRYRPSSPDDSGLGSSRYSSSSSSSSSLLAREHSEARSSLSVSSALSRRSSSTADSLQDLYKAYSPNYVLSRSLTSSVASGRLLGRSEVISSSTTSSLSARDRDLGSGYSASSVKLNLSNGKRVVAVVTPAEDDDDDDEEAPAGPTSASISLQETSNEIAVDAKGEDSNNSSSDESVDDDRDHAAPSPSPGSRRRLTPAVAGGSYSDISSSPRLSRGYTRSSVNERGGLVGLRNIGNTCFMNSVIQCLSNTKLLLEYLLNNDYMSDINDTLSSMKGALITAFSTVIQELWRSDTVVNTIKLKTQIQRFAPRFMGYSQQDAQEFLRYLLEGLHEDVNRVTHRPKLTVTEIEDSLSDSQKANKAWKRYLDIDNSKVVDIFVGQLKSTLRCTVCDHCSVTFDPFWDLSLPIPVRTGQVKLEQCLDSFTREEVLDGDEKPTCSKCQMRQKCTKRFTIQKFPKILVLHLKRFSPTERFRGKLNVTVDFPLNDLDLSAYAAARGQSCMYDLYGVANHSGTTYSGHYTAYCKHPYTGEWHEYNDSRVSRIMPRNIVSSEAYVLFYELYGQSSHL